MINVYTHKPKQIVFVEKRLFIRTQGELLPYRTKKLIGETLTRIQTGMLKNLTIQ